MRQIKVKRKDWPGSTHGEQTRKSPRTLLGHLGAGSDDNVNEPPGEGRKA